MKFRNLIYTVLLIFLFVEVLIVFPNVVEKDSISLADIGFESADKKKKKIKKESSTKASDQKMEGVHLVESQAGVRDWELLAEEAEGSQQTGAWSLKKVKVQFYTKNMIEFTVSGDEGSIDGKSRDLQIKGNVEITSANGYGYRTPAIRYKSKARVMESPGPVFMKGPPDQLSSGVELKGAGLTVWVDTTVMHIRGPVVASRKMSDGKSFEVSSGLAKANGRNQEIDFEGQVGIKYGLIELKGPEASFTYSSKSILSSIKMKSGVEFLDQDKQAEAKEMVFDLIKNQLNFKGSPKVQQGEDVLSGEEIVLLDGGKKVKVERVRARVDNK